ncbi:MAG TPA: serine/threonine-protein kinase, partial [Xanthomonadaceae bacterium]|nr:serine/threonine-protein kinase [Xanthomonadaceae bacterium]
MSTQPSIRDLFEAALGIEPNARTAWLQAHCPDPDRRIAVERMLDADRSDDPPIAIDPARLAQNIGEDTAEFTWSPGHRIGDCELLRVLGEGGSSTVYLARRNIEGVDQQVALKLLHRGLHTPESQRQFRRERQVLARLAHPNIAHMLDGGVTDTGMPYLVMEFVDGLPITAHADQEGLGLRERLRLMVTVARAVATAHQSLIVHRDIKPSNILVTAEGNAKLLDFGIAKLLDEDFGDVVTRTGYAPMTPRYAAPEQFSGGTISTATDVYALGVVLHELLLGDTPASGDTRRPSLRAGTTTGRGSDPLLPPTRLRAALRGDLDNILMKALAEEPERRYAHAAEFAEDIEHHLASRPVRAHPPSAWYRTRKFVGRHRGGVLLTALFALGLVASLALALWQADVARQEAARANAVRDFVVDLFESARVRLPRDQRPTPEALVRQARMRLDAATGLDARTRMDILRTLGEVLLSQSALGDAEAAFAEALALARGLAVPDAAHELRVLRADARQRAGQHASALADLDDSLVALRHADAPLLPRALAVAAAARLGQGDP